MQDEVWGLGKLGHRRLGPQADCPAPPVGGNVREAHFHGMVRCRKGRGLPLWT